jgi:hypothetical protein
LVQRCGSGHRVNTSSSRILESCHPRRTGCRYFSLVCWYSIKFHYCSSCYSMVLSLWPERKGHNFSNSGFWVEARGKTDQAV